MPYIITIIRGFQILWKPRKSALSTIYWVAIPPQHLEAHFIFKFLIKTIYSTQLKRVQKGSVVLLPKRQSYLIISFWGLLAVTLNFLNNMLLSIFLHLSPWAFYETWPVRTWCFSQPAPTWTILLPPLLSMYITNLVLLLLLLRYTSNSFFVLSVSWFILYKIRLSEPVPVLLHLLPPSVSCTFWVFILSRFTICYLVKKSSVHCLWQWFLNCRMH